MSTPRKPCPRDVTDEEWAFVAPSLTLMDEAAPQRRYDLREVFDALRWVVRTGSPSGYLPHAPPRAAAAPHRRYDLREVFDARRWLVRTGSPWRYLPHDLPSWPAVYQ